MILKLFYRILSIFWINKKICKYYMTGYIYFTNPQPMPTSKKYPIIPAKMNMPIFSNNSTVLYKQGSLPSSGAGTVRNASHIGKKT